MLLKYYLYILIIMYKVSLFFHILLFLVKIF